MHFQSACDCYCKIRQPTQHRRNEIQSDRSRVKLVTSKTSGSKTDAIRSARKVPFALANPVNNDEPETKRSSAALPVSPVLSPETSAALEDVDRLVKDAQIQIKAINMVTDYSGLQTPVNAYSNGIFMDDENDQLLYVRERVAYKFQEANGWIDINYRDSRNEGTSYERRSPAKPERLTDFSAPKFKTFEERHKEFPWCGPFGIQNLGAPTLDTKHKRAENPREIPNNERNAKMNTFSVQTCPPVNIERRLTAQNLGNIHISPDPSFIQENVNVGTYIVSHDRVAKVKEKFVKIFEEPKLVANSKKSSENQKKKNNGKTANEMESSSESLHGSLSKGTTADILVHSNEDKQDEKEATAIDEESKERRKSVTSEDAVNLRHRKSEDREVQVEPETFERETENRTTEATSGTKSDQKQVRFNETVEENVEKSASDGRNGKASGPILKRDANISNSIESEDESILNENLERLEDALTAGEIEMHQNHSSLRDKKKKKTEENREYEHNKMINQRFASLRRKYANRNEQNVENSSFLESSSMDTSGEGSDQEDEDELYYPSIDGLDDVLLAYNKTIDDASRSIRTIDKYLSRPELEEFLQNKKTSESNESSKSTRLNRKKVETLKRTSSNYVQSKKADPYGKESIKDHATVKSKRTNEAQQSKDTKSVQLNPTYSNKRDNNSEAKRILPKSSYKTSLRTDSRVVRRSDADSRMLSNVDRDLTESNSDKIARCVEETYANFFNVSRPREATVFRIMDESSSPTSSVDPSFTSTDAQTVNDDKIETISSPKSNVAFVQAVREKPTETNVGLEDKLKTALNVDEMMPILVKNLLQHLQNGVASSPQNLELLITENVSVNNVESNIHEIETARLRTDNGSEKEYSIKEFQADATGLVESDEKIAGKNANDKSTCKNADSDFIDKPTSRSSNSKEESSVAESNRINSTVVEPSTELLSTRSGNSSSNNVKNNHVKVCEYFGQKGDDDGRSASLKKVSSIVDKGTDNDGNKTDGENQNNESICLKKDTVSEATNNSLANSGRIGSTQPNDSLNESSSSKPNFVVENEKVQSCLDQTKSKNLVECNENVRGTLSSDSLRDCASLRSSSRDEPEALSVMKSTGEINNAFNNISRRVSNGKHSSDRHRQTYQKERILSDLYDEVHEQLLHSTHATNYSTLVQQDTRTSENVPSTFSMKLETISSDTSRSEGELFVPSSGSCSLGEIKMLNTSEQDSNIITVFVTKETLNLWSESSKSLVQSMGEI